MIKNMAMILLTGMAVNGTALASNGSQYAGYGSVAMGMGGASIANPTDAIAAANNPAGMGAVGSRVDGNLMATWGKLTSDVRGTHSADNLLVFLPGFGVNFQYRPDVTLGVSVSGYGAGVDYDRVIPAFGTTKVKSALAQLIVAPTATYEFAPGQYVGASVRLGYQSLELNGLQNFGATDDKDDAFGIGWSVGYTGTIAEGLRVGATYFSPVHFQKMKAHADIIPEGGRINMPQQAGLGLAYDIGDWTLAFDYVWINWASENAFGNSLTESGAPGDSNGAGFGWRNQNVFRTGVNYRATDQLQLRAGFSLANHQVPDREATLISIAPCNQPNSFSLGASYQVSKDLEVVGAYMQDFKHTTRGKAASEDTAAGGILHMLSVGVGYKF